MSFAHVKLAHLRADEHKIVSVSFFHDGGVK